jgi:hypothetical protein
MCEFRSLEAALEGHFEKRWADLPGKLRQRIEEDLPLIAGTCDPPPKPDPSPAALAGNIWDVLSADQRRLAAQEWDTKHDPALEQARQASSKAEVQRQELERQIAQWEATSAPTALDLAKKESRLAELRRDLASLASGRPTVTGNQPQEQSVATKSLSRRTTAEQMRQWMFQHQLDLKGAGKRHGRDIILAAARVQFGVAHKIVLNAWNTRSSQKPS